MPKSKWNRQVLLLFSKVQNRACTTISLKFLSPFLDLTVLGSRIYFLNKNRYCNLIFKFTRCDVRRTKERFISSMDFHVRNQSQSISFMTNFTLKSMLCIKQNLQAWLLQTERRTDRMSFSMTLYTKDLPLREFHPLQAEQTLRWVRDRMINVHLRRQRQYALQADLCFALYTY